MIPFFNLEWQVGGTTVTPFGLMVGIGITVAMFTFDRQAKRRCLYPKPILDGTTWALIGGAIGAHWMELFLYQPQDLAKEGPLQIFKFWDGLASTGGMIGGLIASLLFLRRRGLPFEAYADVIALGAAPGWGLARVGCFLVHDHPGKLSHSILAVRFPGGPRQDLGLDEALILFALAALLSALSARGKMTGRLLPLAAVIYGVNRFALDFLRADDLVYFSDRRYAGLTPAQYVCFVMVGWGIWRLIKPMRSPAPQPPEPDGASRGAVVR